MSNETRKNSIHREGFGPLWYLVAGLITLLTLMLCLGAGSVSLPFKETARLLWEALSATKTQTGPHAAILLSVRLPRVLCVLLTGAALSLSGAAMQGLLKNPLADGSTLGVSSGASLGAVLAIAFGITFPGLPFAGTAVFAVLFAFVSLMLILALAYRLDSSLSTQTIILIGVIFSMLVSSVISLIITFVPEKLKSITFWTMGSLAGTTYPDALLLFVSLLLCGTVLLSLTRELNAFAVGEENARHIGIDVKKVRLAVLIAVSVLIGVASAVGGTIGFVGLVVPHMVRLVTGPNHKKLMPASLFGGAVFLMLCDLAARTAAAPRELPLGTVTSLIGAFVFLFLFIRAGRKRV